MIKRMILFILILIIMSLVVTLKLHAWTGDTWGPISRETIVRIADEMIDFSWSPKNTITRNWMYVDKNGVVKWSDPFYSNKIYTGMAYSQDNPQQSWSDFYDSVNNTGGGDTYFGNDCAGFVSMSCRLLKRLLALRDVHEIRFVRSN